MLVLTAPIAAQDTPAERAAALAVADAALAAITRGDTIAFTDLMLPEAVAFPTTRDGVSRYRVRTRAEQRDTPMTVAVTERGWSPEVRVNGPLAMVWSHEGRWRIATMAWSAEQPPACAKHPNGPPPRAKP